MDWLLDALFSGSPYNSSRALRKMPRLPRLVYKRLLCRLNSNNYRITFIQRENWRKLTLWERGGKSTVRNSLLPKHAAFSIPIPWHLQSTVNLFSNFVGIRRYAYTL